MADGPLSLPERIRGLSWSLVGFIVVIYAAVHLLAAIWVWLVVGMIVAGLATAGVWGYRKDRL